MAWKCLRAETPCPWCVALGECFLFTRQNPGLTLSTHSDTGFQEATEWEAWPRGQWALHPGQVRAGEGEGPGTGKGSQSACGCWQSLKGPVPTTRRKEPQDNGSLPQPSSWPLKTALLGRQESASEVTKASGVWGPGGQRHQVWLKTPAPHSQEASPAPHPFPLQEAGWISQDPVGKTAQSSCPGGHHSDAVTQLEKLQRQAGERQAMQRGHQP